MTYSQLRFNQLSNTEQNILLEFLEDLTTEEIRTICRSMPMNRKEINELCKAWDRFVYEQEE